MDTTPLPWLGGLTAQAFLRDYWQQKPLLVRNAFPEAAILLDRDELAGLSLEPEVESRIVIGDGQEWSVRHGPFDENTFSELPDSPWTLLVQAVDHHVPAAAELLENFNFLPNWRIDDLMVSYAVDGGSVGPHFDYYDVFLIQGPGQREWRIGQACDEDTPLITGVPLKLLPFFEQASAWLLEPGDMLYLPPGLAHWGIARGECMTLSVGFRAPSQLDVAEQFLRHLGALLPDHARYTDAGRPPTGHAGHLDDAAIASLRHALRQWVDDDTLFRPFLGEWLSAPKYDTAAVAPDDRFDPDEVQSLLDEDRRVRRDERSRCLYTRHGDAPDGVYVNGVSEPLDTLAAPLLVYLIDHRVYETQRLRALCQSEPALALLTDWLNRGILYIVADDEFP